MTRYTVSAPDAAARARQGRNAAADQQPWRCATCGRAVRRGRNDACACFGPLVETHCYYVTIAVTTDSVPVWSSPRVTLEQGRVLLAQKRDEVREAGWKHIVRLFYRDGTEVREEG